MISKKLLSELRELLLTEFHLSLAPKDLTKLAYSLVGYFDLLLKIDWRNKYGKS